MPQPEYPALAAALVARGFAVIIPQRLGHGKTGGPYLEDPEGCDNGEYALSAQATGEAIEIFGRGGAKAEAAAQGLPLLAEIPIDISMREVADNGRPVGADSVAGAALTQAAAAVRELLGL